jgi:hypothetical protein
LKICENREIRRIFRTIKEKVIGKWRKLHNEEHYNLYSLPNIFRVINSKKSGPMGHVAGMGETKKVHKIYLTETEGKKPPGRCSRRWEEIRIELIEKGSEDDWIHLTQNKVKWLF